MTEHIHSNSFQYSEAIEYSELINAKIRDEYKRGEYIANMINNPNCSNPLAFHNYLIKNGFIKISETNKTLSI